MPELTKLTRADIPFDVEKYFLRFCFEILWQIEPNRDHPHHEPEHWLDEPAKGGRIRTHCKLCGGFIGYRPAKGAERGWK